jgi:hypothetical protein
MAGLLDSMVAVRLDIDPATTHATALSSFIEFVEDTPDERRRKVTLKRAKLTNAAPVEPIHVMLI